MKYLIALCGVLLLTACGGGTDSAAFNQLSNSQNPAAESQAENISVEPHFHRMPLSISAPSEIDRDGRGFSAFMSPREIKTYEDFRALVTSGLTDDLVNNFRKQRGQFGNLAIPNASSTTSIVYTPAQIRSAYNMQALGGDSSLNKGAGQTIYIVDAYHHPKVLQDLNRFSHTFGLPGCTLQAIPTNASVLPPASQTECKLSVIYSTKNGGMTNKVPKYDVRWAQEIALDTQWVHAIAPLARIVLIESPNATIGELGGAIKLANKLGPGVVSMSFSAPEGSWVTQATYSTQLFSTDKMTYLAATGDNGTAVGWPAVVPSVMAVGGTTLNYTANSRSEVAWTGSGGGVSKYVKAPAFQAAVTIPQIPTLKYRVVSDVSMVADPATGVYVFFTAPKAMTADLYQFGGTSLSTPIWAGLFSLVNASRLAQSYPHLGDPHLKLYQMATSAGLYTSNFFDVSTGFNGTCTSCYSTIGYDTPTGLGTPNNASLLQYLSNLI